MIITTQERLDEAKVELAEEIRRLKEKYKRILYVTEIKAIINKELSKKGD